VVLVLFDLLLQLVGRHLLILNDQVDLQLLDTKADGDELRSTPDQTVLLDSENVGLELLEIGLIVCGLLAMRVFDSRAQAVVRTPGLDVHSDNGLGGGLRLAGLLLVVLGQTLSLQLLSLGVLLLVVATEQIDFIVIILGGGGCFGRVDRKLGLLGAVGGVVLGRVTGQCGELRLPREEVVVPAPCVRELLGGRGGLELLEDLDVGLRRGVAVAASALFIASS
jgi:hypothetical protein